MRSEINSHRIAREIEAAAENGNVGQVLVSETDEVRIWRIALKPGERIGFHRHQLDYCWIAITGGRSASRLSDGQEVETTYRPGDCRYYSFGPGEFMIHDLTNIGDTELRFTTVEMKKSSNRPLPLDQELSREPPFERSRDNA